MVLIHWAKFFYLYSKTAVFFSRKFVVIPDLYKKFWAREATD